MLLNDWRTYWHSTFSFVVLSWLASLAAVMMGMWRVGQRDYIPAFIEELASGYDYSRT